MTKSSNETPEYSSDEFSAATSFEDVFAAEGDRHVDDVVRGTGNQESTTADSKGDAEITVQSLTAQLADAEKRVLLAHADLENFRRRMRRDMEEQVRYASLRLISEVLEAVDNLNRALEAHEKDPHSTSATLAEGVKLVSQQIANTLANHGATKIEAVGQPFDPNLHQALTMQPSEDHAPNTVMIDLRPGFQLHDRVIRPSQVIVSQ